MVDPPAAASMVRYLRVAADGSKKNSNWLFNDKDDQHDIMAAKIINCCQTLVLTSVLCIHLIKNCW